MDDLNTIRIDLTSKDGREVVENLLRAADAPGALTGRAKNAAAIVFRSTWPRRIVPYFPGADHSQRVFEIASRDGAIRIKISTDSTAPLDGFKFDRDIPRYELSVATYTAADVGTRILKAAFELGLSWASQVDDALAVEARMARFREDAGRVKVRTPEEIAADAEARRDAEMVKNTEGREIVSEFPTNEEQQILAARGRHAVRQRKQTTAA